MATPQCAAAPCPLVVFILCLRAEKSGRPAAQKTLGRGSGRQPFSTGFPQTALFSVRGCGGVPRGNAPIGRCPRAPASNVARLWRELAPSTHGPMPRPPRVIPAQELGPRLPVQTAIHGWPGIACAAVQCRSLSARPQRRPFRRATTSLASLPYSGPHPKPQDVAGTAQPAFLDYGHLGAEDRRLGRDRRRHGPAHLPAPRICRRLGIGRIV